MNDQPTAVTHFAILIGINNYPDKPLRGCVQDTQNIKTYLESVSNSINIQTFTASENVDPLSSSPAEDPMLWPTYDNIISALEKVTSIARAGDFVYIHYSGHGTRVEASSEFSNKSTGDLALVLLDKVNGTTYFWGSMLASLINTMVRNGLVVTLVLDCCFSASVYRHDDHSIRFLPYDSEIALKSPLDPETIPDNEANDRGSRDASMLPNWLVKPDRYAILSACGPHEVAIELKSNGSEQRHGALSYFLHRSLIECEDITKKHKNIYSHLRAKFRKSLPHQNPVLYGNKDQGFFGNSNSNITTATVSIIEKAGGSFQLQAGQAHGVCEGDQFALYPFSSEAHDSRLKGDPLPAKVTHARALTSNLEPLDMKPVRARTGWAARALTRLSLRRFPIRLASELLYREELSVALTKRSLSIYNNDSPSFSFHVTLNSNQEYQIRDESDQEIPNLPIVTQDQTNINYVCGLMEHLASFHLAKNLIGNGSENPFRKSFDVYIASHDGLFHSESPISVNHDDIVELVVENKGDKELYLYIYDLGPSWQIENILRGSYEVIPPQQDKQGFSGVSKKKLKMIIPSKMRETGHRQCEDIVKVFLTLQPTTFDLLELPELGEAPEDRTSSRSGLEGGIYSSEDWAALNFHIRTSLE